MNAFKPLIDMFISMCSNHVIWRMMNLITSGLGFIIFITSITHETGSSSFYPFILPIVASIAIILLFKNRNKLIQLLGYICVIMAFATHLNINGSFIHYTMTGLGVFILFFNTFRPWKK